MISATTGAGQEYFLNGRNFFFARPDLLNAGWTLFGARSPKIQELQDQYFDGIPDRVPACMLETERELYKLGVRVKMRHNEIAPAQCKIAPLYEDANVTTDRQCMVMLQLQRAAQKYGMACLPHRKPRSKASTARARILISRSASRTCTCWIGATPHHIVQFLAFCAAVIHAVNRHGDLLRAVVASASNGHGLGAHEAPPSIMSVYLGDQLTDVF